MQARCKLGESSPGAHRCRVDLLGVESIGLANRQQPSWHSALTAISSPIMARAVASQKQQMVKATFLPLDPGSVESTL